MIINPIIKHLLPDAPATPPPPHPPGTPSEEARGLERVKQGGREGGMREREGGIEGERRRGGEKEQ